MIKSLVSLYARSYVHVLVDAFAVRGHDIGKYISWYSATSRFVSADNGKKLSYVDKILVFLMQFLYVISIGFAMFLVYAGIAKDYAGGVYFGLACFVAIPIFLAAILPAMHVISKILSLILLPKRVGKAFLCSILEFQVKRLRKKHAFTVVAVAGSIGKTSTKLAIANTLKNSGKRVKYQEGNYNDRLTVPLVIFGHSLPNLLNIFAWVRIVIENEYKIYSKYPWSIVVVELGTDGPGQIEKFAYLKPELTVITGIAPEHMEYFGSLDAVAREELSAVGFSRQVIINADDTAASYIKHIKCMRYGTDKQYEFTVAAKNSDLFGQDMTFIYGEKHLITQRVQLIGLSGAKIALAAVAVASQLGVNLSKVSAALSKLKPPAGRMQLLEGINNSILIDDTYNSSPLAVKSALEVLQSTKAKKRIAVLGSMNELGLTSPRAHKEIVDYIDPKKIDLVVTIGRDAHDYTAPTARKKGCDVRAFLSPYAAGEYLVEHIISDSVVLFKGSQNGVFAEEAIKSLLANPKDADKLVRQSSYWLRQKRSL